PDVLQRERRRGWEIKLVSWDQRGEWGPYPEDVPDHYQFQVVWHMAVMEYDSWTVVARMGDDAPVGFNFFRDQQVEDAVIRKARTIYERYILGDEMPPIDGSKAASAWLQHTFPRHKRPDLRPATAEETAILREYEKLRIEQRAIQRERDTLE